MSRQTEHPVFPPEIEKMIFELAVTQRREAPRLMLVAYRVYEWVAAKLYNVINHLSQPEDREYTNDPLNVHYYGVFVKHLALGGSCSPELIRKFLEACPNLVDLALWSQYPTRVFLPLLQIRRLERLSTSLDGIAREGLRASAFACITHLDITEFGTRTKAWKGLGGLPCLSHVCINEAVTMKVVRELLRSCVRLRILVLMQVHDEGEWGLDVSLVKDLRLVAIRLVRFDVYDWCQGAMGGDDLWKWAENISALRETHLEDRPNEWFSVQSWRHLLRRMRLPSRERST